MDLSSAKVTPEQKVSLCTKYFYLGFLCLPFLWGVNAAWFFGEAFRYFIMSLKPTLCSYTLCSYRSTMYSMHITYLLTSYCHFDNIESIALQETRV